LWRIAVLGYWALLIPTGWAFFLPGILDRLKFTDSLVGHSILAMAGFVSSLLILILAILLDEDGLIFNARWPFIAWHGGTLAYVILFFFTGWKEGGDPAFTIVPGPARNLIYAVRLVLGVAMTAASAHWLVDLTRRLRSRSASDSGQPSSWRLPVHPEVERS
jgi:cytochrome c oxidase cbb3-type subunit 1